MFDINEPLEFVARIQILPLDRKDRVKQYVRYCKVKGIDIDKLIIDRLEGREGAPRD